VSSWRHTQCACCCGPDVPTAKMMRPPGWVSTLHKSAPPVDHSSMPGTLYYGDNLDVLREHIKDETVDLVYLDPPFNSQRVYNVLHKEHDNTESQAQARAFEDYWSWDARAQNAYEELVSPSRSRNVPAQLSATLELMRHALDRTDRDLMAYVVMMSIRLVELWRVLKPTGSLYLHCDSGASHYLRVVLDSLFGQRNFRNELVWKRSSAHSDTKQGSRHFGRVTDTILFYSKAEACTFNQIYGPYDPHYVAENYKRQDADGRIYRIDNIQGPGGAAKGNPRYEFLGVTRYWRYSRARMQELYDEGRIIQTRPGAVPQYKRYLDEMPGVPLQNLWTDISVINNRSKERIGYPTQKPVALLERILKASSNEGDLVLDPFCGCGTTIEAAHRLKRNWVGIDITHIAISVIRRRLTTVFGDTAQYKVHGEPADLESARVLAGADPHEFQAWIVDKVGGVAVSSGAPGARSGKKGMDRGVDGVILFRDDPKAAQSRRIVISVKAGKNISPSMVRDLLGTIAIEGADIGVLLLMAEPTKEMRRAAAGAGTFSSATFNPDERYSKIQILSAREVLEGKRVSYPGQNRSKRSLRPTSHAGDAQTAIQFQDLNPTPLEELEEVLTSTPAANGNARSRKPLAKARTSLKRKGNDSASSA
jgi:DNA modification methylase